MTILRPATEADLPALTRLGQEAFVDKFGHLYKAEDLAMFLRDYRTEARYRDQLADPGTLVQLAEEDGQLLGYCLIARGDDFEERPLPHPARPVVLSQLYCAPNAIGRGIGSQLMDWALAEAKAWRADAIQLSVYAENFGAQKFYRRFGFDKVADIDFWVGNHRDDEFLFELKL
jgi:ribosomal protein S18 acetylase RimI-like enzyme